MKKLLSMLLVLTLVLTLAPVAGAIPITPDVTVIDSGDCGTNLTWTLMSDGELIISGTGAMRNWYPSSSVWYSYCSSIKSVSIESGVTTIGNCAFLYCTSLTSVTIPNSVTTIGYDAFDGCTSLTSVTIPNSVTTIGKWAFDRCDSLTSITVSAGNPNYSSRDGVLFNKDKTTLIQCPGGKAGAYIIPNSVTTIGDFAFEYCTSLTSVTIPDSVTTIGGGAFDDCTSLASVTIGNSVTTIGDWAFGGCASLTSVMIPNSVTTIGNDAFAYCNSLTYNIYDNAKYLGNDSNPYLYLADTTSNSITNCTIHPNTRFIGEYAFGGCASLTSITIPDSVTTIGNSAFYNCNSLTSVTIGTSVTTIGNSAFRDCTSLTSVTIPDSVTTIGNSAFYECYSLTSVTIPNSVTTIGEYAFYYCTSLTDVYYNGTQKQWEKIEIGSDNEKLLSAALHTLPEPQLTDYSLNLDSAIRLNFYVSEVPGFTSYIDMGGTRYDKKGDYYPTREFNAKEMADNITVKLKYEYDGEITESTSFTTSIQKYAEAVLKDVDWNTPDGDFGAKSGRLMVSMLNYGAEAQEYFSYNTANLANANIGEYQSYLTPAPAATNERTGSENDLYYGTSVVLGANMNMKFYLKLKTAEDKEGWNYQISYTNYLGQKNVINLTFAELTDAQNGFYAYTLTDLVAADIDTLVTFKILDDGTEKLAVTDSISSYLARVVDSNPDCIDVANAMLTFGAMAYDYFYTLPVAPPALGDDELPIG